MIFLCVESVDKPWGPALRACGFFVLDPLHGPLGYLGFNSLGFWVCSLGFRVRVSIEGLGLLEFKVYAQAFSGRSLKTSLVASDPPRAVKISRISGQVLYDIHARRCGPKLFSVQRP